MSYNLNIKKRRRKEKRKIGHHRERGKEKIYRKSNNLMSKISFSLPP